MSEEGAGGAPTAQDEFDLDMRIMPGMSHGELWAMGNTASVCGTNCGPCQDPSKTCECGRTAFTQCGSCTCNQSDRTCEGCPSFESQCKSCQGPCRTEGACNTNPDDDGCHK